MRPEPESCDSDDESEEDEGRHVGHTVVFQDAEDSGLVSHRWEDRYPVRSHPPESFFRYFLLCLTFLDYFCLPPSLSSRWANS